MRTMAVAKRLLNQIRHDKRTIALVIGAPLILLTLVYFIFTQNDPVYQVGIVDADDSYVAELKTNDGVEVQRVTKGREKDVIGSGKVIATLKIEGNKGEIQLDASDPAKAKKVEAMVKSASFEELKTEIDQVKKDAEELETKIGDLKQTMKDMAKVPGISGLPKVDDIGEMPRLPEETTWKTVYLYGEEDGNLFNNMGAALMGLVVFFFTYLIAGINFLTERTSGTLEKLLSTPIRRREIIIGYVIGFSVLALIQSILTTIFVVYVLGLSLAGSIWYVLLTVILTAVASLTMALLLSTLASSEFQVIQFIPIVLLPQVFLCGLFELNGGWDVAGHFMPLYYTVDALKGIMLKGYGIGEIWPNLLVLAAISCLFIVLNIKVLKKQRGI